MPPTDNPALCGSCGRSALEIATNDLSYCERIGCCDWKHERRQSAWLIPAPVEFAMPLDFLLSDEDLEVGLG